MKKNNYDRVSWDTNDMAFLIYADYKGASQIQIAKLYNVSPASISQQMQKLRKPETYSKRTQEKIEKAGVLEMKVRGGSYPDHRKQWDERLTKVTGIAYTYPKPPEELVDDEPEKVEEVKQHPPLLQLTINTESVISIIRAWRGIND